MSGVRRLKTKDFDDLPFAFQTIYGRFGNVTNAEDLIMFELKRNVTDEVLKETALKYCMQHGLDNITDVWPHIVGVDNK